MSNTQLIDQYIEPNPYRPGAANARLREYGVSIWALVGYYEAVRRDPDRVAHDYRLPREAVDAALAYYQKHKNAIDARLAENVA